MKLSKKMPYKILEMEQGSPEWHKIRSECVTGTMAKYLMKDGLQSTLQRVKNSYEYQQSHPYVGAAAQRGHDLEPIARTLANTKLALSDKYSEVEFKEVGFVKRTDMEHVGCSPDGCYIEDGRIKYNLEIKCFQEKHHLECSGTPDFDIMAQIQWCLWVTDADACFFVQYNPDMIDENLTSDGKAHPDQVFFIRKITPDLDYFTRFTERMSEALQEK